MATFNSENHGLWVVALCIIFLSWIGIRDKKNWNCDCFRLWG